MEKPSPTLNFSSEIKSCPESSGGDEAGIDGTTSSGSAKTKAKEAVPSTPHPLSENMAYEQSRRDTRSTEVDENVANGNAKGPNSSSSSVCSHLDETAVSQPQAQATTTMSGGDATVHKEMENRLAIDTMLAEISTGLKMECMQWTRVFRESEQFEISSSSHVEKLLEEAVEMEQNMLQQKERLMSQLKLLSQTLKLP